MFISIGTVFGLYVIAYVTIPLSVASNHDILAASVLCWIVLIAYIIQGAVYSVIVFVRLLPALKKLDQMSKEQNSILCQFYVFMLAIVLKIIILIIFITTEI